jgi:hypothetical protein
MLTCGDQVKIFKLCKYVKSLTPQSSTLKPVAVVCGTTSFVCWISVPFDSIKILYRKNKKFSSVNLFFKNFFKKL